MYLYITIRSFIHRYIYFFLFEALHSLIGAGFLAATFLVKPFLPEDNEDTFDDVCIFNKTDSADNAPTEILSGSHNEKWYGVSRIAWPFIISGSWCIIFSFGYAILGIKKYFIIMLSTYDLQNKKLPNIKCIHIYLRMFTVQNAPIL